MYPTGSLRRKGKIRLDMRRTAAMRRELRPAGANGDAVGGAHLSNPQGLAAGLDARNTIFSTDAFHVHFARCRSSHAAAGAEGPAYRSHYTINLLETYMKLTQYVVAILLAVLFGSTPFLAMLPGDGHAEVTQSTSIQGE